MTQVPRVPVLLVDDAPANLVALEALFLEDGYELVLVRSGADAIRAVAERDFAVALVDVQMPGMDGFETAFRMREVVSARHPVPVIFVTGIDAAPARISQAYALGAVDFVEKPLKPDVMRAKVALFAELWRARRLLVVEREAAARSLAALTALALALAATRTAEDVAAAIIEHGMQVARADTCSLYVLDASGKGLELVAHRGIAPELVDRIRVLDERSAPQTFAALRSETVTWAETAQDYARLHPALAATRTEGRRASAFWSMPLVAEGRAAGLLGMGFYEERTFSTEERRLVDTLGKQCAQALLRAMRWEREERAHAWLSTTLRSIGDAVIATDTRGRVTFMNGVAEALTGWSEDEARERSLEEVFAIFSEETRMPQESPVAKVLREGRVVGLANHTVLRPKTGADIPIDDSAAPIQDPRGNLLGVVLVFRDATAEKSEQARQRFLARAGTTLVSSLEYRTTLAAVAEFAVPELADWCGVDLVEGGTLQQVAVAHVDPQKVAWARELGRRYPADPGAERGTAHVIRTGQSELYVTIAPEMLEASARDATHLRLLRDLRLESAMIVPLRGRERVLGAMTFVYADSGRRYSSRDLTFAEEFARRAAMAIESALALREAEEARVQQGQAAAHELFASEFKFHQLVDAVTEYAIFMLDAQGHVQTWNAGAQRAKGYAASEILGAHFSVFYTPQDRASGRPARILETVRREGRYAEEGWRVRKDGTRFWAHVSLAALRDGAGEVVGFAKVTRDLTEKRAADENERELLREQAARAATEEAREELERLNRAKDEFLATMSHELRTPLNAISGWASILRKKPVPEPQLERGLEVIERNAKAQTRLIDDLLDVSRIVSGKLRLAIGKTEVLPLIVAAADVVRPAADGKGVELVVDVDPAIGAAMADPDRLQQVVWNLLSNAVRFTGRGGRVAVTGGRAGSGIVIRVRDTGAGIGAEHLPYIFERFRQVDSKTTRKHGGLGLGLSIVRHLVEAHGGSVEAHSEGLGHGAVFTVHLPVPAVNTVPPPPPLEGEIPSNPEPHPVGLPDVASLEDVHVLVVDDDSDSLTLLHTVLESAGARVTSATGAEEALRELDAHARFDILISDIGMPDVDGCSLMRRIRARESNRGGDMPAIALSAFARDVDAEGAKHAGFQQHLAKPVDESELLRAVRTWSSATARRTVGKPIS